MALSFFSTKSIRGTTWNFFFKISNYTGCFHDFTCLIRYNWRSLTIFFASVSGVLVYGWSQNSGFHRRNARNILILCIRSKTLILALNKFSDFQNLDTLILLFTMTEQSMLKTSLSPFQKEDAMDLGNPWSKEFENWTVHFWEKKTTTHI